MTDFSKLEARLDSALKTLADPKWRSVGDPSIIDKLKGQVADLTKESITSLAKTNEIREQLKVARSKISQLREQLIEQSDSLASHAKEAESLRAAQADAINQRDKARQYTLQLKEANFELRKKNEEMVGDAGLINSNLERDMAKLNEQHALDLAEVNGILARLTPLVEGN